MDTEPFMTEREVAAWLRMSVQTVRKWHCDGSGPPYYKVGRSVRYGKSNVADWARGTIVEPKQQPLRPADVVDLEELLEKQGRGDPYCSGVKVE